MKHAVLIAASMAAVAMTASAARAADAPQQCFFTRDIDNFTATNDDHTLYLRVRGNQYYQLNIRNQCPNLSWHDAIVLQSVSGSPEVCTPIEINLRVRSAGISVPCIIDDMHHMTADEVAAIPKKLKP